MEGIPLGFNYHSNSTEPALYLAIATHKFPEAILVASLLIATGNRTKIIPTIVLFSAITPVTAILAHNLGIYFLFVSTIISVIIPIVAGAFLHIATTIFFESGTKHHMLTNKKILAILLGVGLGLLTTLIHD
jgi:zinc transporter ZupT